MSKMRKRVIAYGVILVLILCFIWGNSMLSREMSGAISHFVADIFGGEQGASDEGHFLVRKAGHFFEFACLGVAFLLFSREILKDGIRRALAIALVGVSVPLIDETIQIFSNRGYALPDVWIDISGYLLGSAVVIVALGIWQFIWKKRKNQQV